jgi:DNA-binding SARP family transcriptional activator
MHETDRFGVGAPHPSPDEHARRGAPALTAGAFEAGVTASTKAGPGEAAPGPPLNVHMLDGFQVWLDGEPLGALPAGKARSLLKLLLLRRRRPLSRARLCSLFWPEADTDSARNSLNVTLHRLRRTLGRGSLVRHCDDGYQLAHAGPVWLDTEQFSLHAEMGRLEEAQGRSVNAIAQYEAALAIYRSDLLDRIDAGDPLAGDAQALRDVVNRVLERLAALHEAAGDWHGCLRAALRHLEMDRCNEHAHRQLMRCYANLGQLQLAERQYRSCARVLGERLGLRPSEETTALYRRITSRLTP